MSWRIIPTRLIPMYHRLETDLFRHHRDMAATFWRSFENAWKDLDRVDRNMDPRHMRPTRGRFEDSNGLCPGKSPYVTDEAGNRKLQLRYDVSKYKPEEISVKMVDNTLVVNAKQMKEEAGEKWYSELTREFTIPKEIDPAELKSTLSPDGILQVEAPVNAETVAPKEIPIEFTKEGIKEGTEGKE